MVRRAGFLVTEWESAPFAITVLVAAPELGDLGAADFVRRRGVVASHRQEAHYGERSVPQWLDSAGQEPELLGWPFSRCTGNCQTNRWDIGM